MSKNIVLIQFSSRKQGNCSSISREITDHYRKEVVTRFTADSSIIQPCNNCNYECLTPGKLCPNLSKPQRQIMDAVCTADLAYFIVPNYCGYPCANYFAFNEKTAGYFNMDRDLMQKYMKVPKRFIVVSNTEGQNFENALKQQVISESEILYMKTSKYHKRSIAGDMMDSLDAKADLNAFLERCSF